MDERELEQRLRTAVEHAAPDPLDRILAACGPQAGTVLPFEAPKKKRRWAPLAVAAALVVMCCGAFGISSWRGANAVDSVVMLDVNPSLSMTVSSKERVLSVTPFNQDAEVILGDMDLTGTDLDVAVNALIGSMLQNGYLSDIQNAILVSVENQDAAKSAQLQQHLTDTINSVFQGGSLEGAVLSQTVTESADLNALAQQYGISVGKAALIQTIADSSSGLYTFEELVGLPINDLNLLYTSLFSFRPADPEDIGVIGGSDGSSSVQTLPSSGMIQTSGQASDSAYIGVEAAQAAAFSHAGVSAAQATVLEIDFDYEDGRMVYELEFYANGSEYEYDIDALTGAVVKSQQESRGSAPSGGAPSGADIGEQGAKEAALAHAGLTEGDVVSLSVKREYDDGRLEYEVKFWVDTTEYEYTVDGATGDIRKSEREPHPSASSADIGQDQAVSIALAHAGLSQSQVYRLEAEREWEDDHLEYQVEFKAGGMEYSYDIAASDGAILSFEREKD